MQFELIARLLGGFVLLESVCCMQKRKGQLKNEVKQAKLQLSDANRELKAECEHESDLKASLHSISQQNLFIEGMSSQLQQEISRLRRVNDDLKVSCWPQHPCQHRSLQCSAPCCNLAHTSRKPRSCSTFAPQYAFSRLAFYTIAEQTLVLL